ncbi:unnamed protein product, partial [marine sediment metagenome]
GLTDCNYVGVFLTFCCNYRCSYCINQHSGRPHSSGNLSAEQWIAAFNRLEPPGDLPITLQGGEPTLHGEFYELINGIDESINIDLLTNMQFDVEDFCSKIPPHRLRRQAPYASIRVSFHPEVMDLQETIDKALAMQRRGYSIGLFGVLHPKQETVIRDAKQRCGQVGLDFRTKDFLGYYQGRLYGEYRYPDSVNGKNMQHVLCRTTELLIDPAGLIYRCHRDLYGGQNAIGSILDQTIPVPGQFRPCRQFGQCSPCDVKLKNNRFSTIWTLFG